MSLIYLNVLVNLKVGLRVFINENVEVYSAGKHFRLVVVDLDKQASYPGNFVCLLPAHFTNKGKMQSAFTQIFKEKSLEKAKALLTEALDSEQDSDVKAEIERRLELLEPEKAKVKCSGCRRLFQPRRVRKYSPNFCEECLRKRFGDRG